MSQGNEQGEGGVVALIILVVVFLLFKDTFLKYVVMAWKPIMQGFFTIWYYVPDAISSRLFLWMDGNIQVTSEKVLKILNNPPMYFVKNKKVFEQVNLYSGSMVFPYFAILLSILAWKIFNKKELNRIFDIDRLAINESRLWPQIKPVLFENIHTQSLHKGPWAAAKKPEKYIKDINAVIEFEDDIGDKKFRINKDIVIDSFLKQIGNPWSNPNKLKEHERQLFALFAAKISRDAKISKDIVSAMSNAYTSEKFSKISFLDKMKKRKLMKVVNTIADEAVSKYTTNKDVAEVIDKHFFNKTVLAGLLEKAREDGVLPSADFIWLKKKDRTLWYLMSNLGRRAAFIECSGVWCHYLAENAFGRKVAMPMVYNAVKALDVYLETCSEEYVPLQKDSDDDD